MGRKFGVQLRGHVFSAFILAEILLLIGSPGIGRGDMLEANGPGQNLTSVDRIYSTSTAKPAMLAIHGGTILSISDRLALHRIRRIGIWCARTESGAIRLTDLPIYPQDLLERR